MGFRIYIRCHRLSGWKLQERGRGGQDDAPTGRVTESFSSGIRDETCLSQYAEKSKHIEGEIIGRYLPCQLISVFLGSTADSSYTKDLCLIDFRVSGSLHSCMIDVSNSSRVCFIFFSLLISSCIWTGKTGALFLDGSVHRSAGPTTRSGERGGAKARCRRLPPPVEAARVSSIPGPQSSSSTSTLDDGVIFIHELAPSQLFEGA